MEYLKENDLRYKKKSREVHSEVNIENEQEAIFKEDMHENFLFLMKDFRIRKYSESQD